MDSEKKLFHIINRICKCKEEIIDPRLLICTACGEDLPRKDLYKSYNLLTPMTQDETELEAEAVALFNCDKNLLHYLVNSAGSIGPSKLVKAEDE